MKSISLFPFAFCQRDGDGKQQQQMEQQDRQEFVGPHAAAGLPSNSQGGGEEMARGRTPVHSRSLEEAE